MYKKILKVGEWIEVCSASDMEHFDVGVVLALDDEGVLLASVDPAGKEDGITYLDFSILNMFRKNTQYIDKMKKLVEAYGEKLATIEIGEGDLKTQLLKKCARDNKLVTISLTDGVETHIEGFVADIEEDFCTVNEYDAYGMPDGQTIFSVKEIYQASYNRQRARKLYALIQP